MSKKGRRVSFALPEEPEENGQEENSVKVSLEGGTEFDNEVETAHYVDSSDSDSTDSEDSEAVEYESLKQMKEKSKREEDVRQKKKDTNKEQGDGDRLKQERGESKRTRSAGISAGRTSDDDGTDSEVESDSDSGADEEGSDRSDVQSDDGTTDTSSESGSDSKAENELSINGTPVEKPPAPIKTFAEMGLDPRLERAIEKMDWLKPTPIQCAVIPAALHGRDVLVSSPTGSGKTAAYAIPIAQHICKCDSDVNGLRAVVLVPTRELVHQVASVLKGLCKYVDGIQVAALTGSFTGGLEKHGRRKKGNNLSFGQAADIVVGTPAAVMSADNAQEGSSLSKVEFVVVDEADLVLGYGYENDAKTALSRVPASAQCMLLSATLEAEGMDRFKSVILRRPLTIKITWDEGAEEGDTSGALHYHARLKLHRDRYLVAYAMLRLNVITGKVLIFVNHINAAFRLKLFLDQFKVKSAVLNNELPVNSRVHCVEQFNGGVFDILIVSDESQGTEDNAGGSSGRKREGRGRKRLRKDWQFGLSRGVDFRDVTAVLNFDVPETSGSYTHRAGRTARGGKTGTVLTLVCNEKEEERLRTIGREEGCHIAPLAFRMDQMEAFRYRVEDALRMVTDAVIHGARLADVRREIVNSEQLKEYFEDRPEDLDALQHNLRLAKNIPEHLGHIPSYLVPAALRGKVSNEATGSLFKGRRRGLRRGVGAGNGRKKGDPLKTFTTNGVSGSARQRYRTKHGLKKRKGRDDGQTAVKKRRRR